MRISEQTNCSDSSEANTTNSTADIRSATGSGTELGKRRASHKATKRPDSGQSALPTVQGALRGPKRGGPTSQRGKERSGRNAVKHGIFAKMLLLKGESSTEFYSLLQGFRDYLQPEGMPEEVLVEKLACLTWRWRRMLAAERVETEAQRLYSTKNDEWSKQQWVEALNIWTAAKENFGGGLLRRCDNPLILNKCIELLESLKSAIKYELDDFVRDAGKLLFDQLSYSPLSLLEDLATVIQSRTHAVDAANCDIPREERKAAVLEVLDLRITVLKLMAVTNEERSAQRVDLERESCAVPDPAKLDRFVRYSANLERDFDRTLAQLERLQRMRRGQPVAPPINVNLS